MLGVNIHEGIVLAKETQINEEKGNLELHFKTLPKKGEDMWAAMEGGEEVTEDNVRIIIWDINMTTFNGDVKTVAQIAKELQNLENQLRAILKVYLTTDKITEYHGGTKMFVNTGISKANFATKLLDADSVKKVQTTICSSFIKACTDNNLFENEQTFRLKLVRQSKAKHYPKLPGVWGTWIESSAIPKDQSQVKWSKYEKDNGLDSNEALAADNVVEAEETTAKSLFSNIETDEETTIE